MKKFITILIVLVVSLPFVVAHFLKTPEEENIESKTINEEGYSEKGFVRKGTGPDGKTYDEVISKRSKLLEKMKNKENNLHERSITNDIANNLNRDISINYFNASEQSVLFNTYINESSVGF